MSKPNHSDSHHNTPDLLTPAEAASYLRIPQATLSDWRYRRTGPNFLKVGRHVRYRPSDVEAWLHERAQLAAVPSDRTVR